MSDILEKSLFGISEGSAVIYSRWTVQKVTTLPFWRNVSPGLRIPKIEIGPLLTELFYNKKVAVFWDTVYIGPTHPPR